MQTTIEITAEQIEQIAAIYRGNPTAHYTLTKPRGYLSVKRGITLDDVARHLRGEEPSILSIPINHDGISFFGAIDVDRHDISEINYIAEPIDCVALARKITELQLPLIVLSSTNGKGCWVTLIIKGAGFPARKVQVLLSRYRKVLKLDELQAEHQAIVASSVNPGESIPEVIEIFPKQIELEEGKPGGGINLPYFGEQRAALGPDGEKLSLEDFLALVEKRKEYGHLLVERHLSGEPSALETPKTEQPKSTQQPLSATNAKIKLAGLLEKLAKCSKGTRSQTLNDTYFFAGQVFASKALAATETQIKAAIRQAAKHIKPAMDEEKISKIEREGWNDGLKKPISVMNWREYFRTGSQLETGAVKVYIDKILPEGVTGIGSLSAVGKTWLALSMARALSTGTKFLGVFDVPEAVPVLYLVPEMGDRALRMRMEKLNLPMNDGFYCQTIRDGICKLNDSRLQDMISELKPIVFLDTIVRFNPSEDENSSRQNASLLANSLFLLIKWGARAVVFLHHSPKYSADTEFMTLENVLRGTGDLGAMCDAVWGIQHDKQKSNGKDWDFEYLEESQNLTRLSLRCVKPRDFEPSPPFRIQGRPYIDEKSDFVVIVEYDEKSLEEKIVNKIKANPKISGLSIRNEFRIGLKRVNDITSSRGWRQNGKIWTHESEAPFQAQALPFDAQR